MEDYKVSEVANILNEWNPLGDDSVFVKDLDGYKAESIDILFHIQARNSQSGIERTVMEVLNEAFEIELSRSECADAASKIFRLLKNKH